MFSDCSFGGNGVSVRFRGSGCSTVGWWKGMFVGVPAVAFSMSDYKLEWIILGAP